MVFSPQFNSHRETAEQTRQRLGITPFAPQMSHDETRQVVSIYGQNRTLNTPERTSFIANHANYHNIPFDGGFSVSEAIMQFAKGMFSGFTTFNVGEPPDNVYEGIARSMGHLVGFAPGMVAAPLAKIPALAGWAAKLATVKSVPFMGAHFIRKKATQILGPAMKTAVGGRAAAASTAGNFLLKHKGPLKHVAEGAFDLGVASGLSAWQGGVNAMVESTFHGAAAGAVFRTLGNAIKLGDETATKLTRALAGSLYTGLQAEARGATTPEKVYEYLLGAFFGYSEAPWYRAGSAKFMKKFTKKAVKNAELDVTKDPELMGEEWSNLEPEIQQQVRKDMKAQGFDMDGGRAMGYSIIEALGLKDKYGNVTKESWEKTRDILRGKEIDEGLEVSSYADIPEVKPAEERLMEKIGKIQKQIVDNETKIYELGESFEKEEAIFKETGKKTALYHVYSDKVEALLNKNLKNQELKERLVKGLGKELDVSKSEENIDNDTADTGEKNDNPRIGTLSMNFTEKWLKDLFKVPDVGAAIQKDLRTVIASRVHSEVMKHVELGKSPNTDKLAENLQKELGAPLSSEARGELRQWLNVQNNGHKQHYMRLVYTPGTKKKAAKYVWQPMYIDRPITKGGNKKDNIEPIKLMEEIVLKEGGKADKDYGIIIHVDHMSMKNKAGHWKDYKLSMMRRDNPEVYEEAFGNLIKDMHKKGFYLFSGRGDSNKFIFSKYHPKTEQLIKQSGLGKTMNVLIGHAGKRKSEYKKALDIFRKQYPNLKEGESRRMFDRAFMSNLLYDMGMQGYSYTGANLKKMWGPKETTGFIDNALDYNKRLQILLSPAWSGSKEYARTEFAKDKIFKKHKGFRYAIVKDIAEIVEHDEKLLEFNADRFKEITDGAIIGRDDVVNFNNKDAGQPTSGQNKAFIVSPDAKNGALYGKFMFHKAGKKLSEQMEKQGLHYIVMESSAKQVGKRNIGTYDITPKGKLSINAEAYTLDPTHIKYSYSVKQSDSMYKHRARIPKQWFSALNSRTAHAPISTEVINDIFSETISKSYSGEAKWNNSLAEYLKNPTPAKEAELIKNIERIGVNNLLEVVNANEGTRFADAVYEKMLKLNKEIAIEDARENGIKESEVAEYSEELNTFDTVTKRILKLGVDVAKGKDIKSSPIYLHKWIRPYRLNVMRNYIMSHIAKPKLGNSAAARMRPYDKALMMNLDKESGGSNRLKDLMVKDDIFFLDNRYMDMPIETHLPGKWRKTTLGKLWEGYTGKEKAQFKGLEAEVEEILRAMVIRVPMDSASGAHALKFGGFTGRDGHGVLLHPRTMRALGGADLDGDEAFVYFGGKNARGTGQGMKKTWKDAFESNKNEYVEYVSRKKINGEYLYLTKDEYNKGSESKKKLYAEYIPDPKKGMINRPDGKNKGQTMEDLLTEGKSEFSTLAGKSQIWMYAPSIRRQVSERVVDGRELMGGVVSMTQTMKASHDIISTSKDGSDIFIFKDWNGMRKVKTEAESNFKSKAGNLFHVPEYEVIIKARTDKKWLDYARRLSSSMTAFTADPMDTGGLKRYSDYFKELHNAYFEISNLKELPKPGKKVKAKDIDLKSTEDFFDYFKPPKGAKSPIWNLRNGILKNFMEMNSALYGKNYKAGRVWQENEIKNKVDFIGEFEEDQLTNILAKQAKMVKDSPKWTDDILNKIDKTKLEQLYTDINKLSKDYKFLAGMMGRSTFTIPPSKFVQRLLDWRMMDATQRAVVSESAIAFKNFMEGLGYTRNKQVSIPTKIRKKVKGKMVTRTKWVRRRENAQEFMDNIESLENAERLEILNDVYNKSQDFVINDIHDMISLKRIVDLYEANRDILDMPTIEKIFNEVERVKQNSYLMRKERTDAESFYEKTENMTPDELEAYNIIIKKLVESGERKVGEPSAELDQIQIDKRIKNFKSKLKTDAEKNLYDALMLGTYNRSEMAKRSKVDLDDPDLKHEFIMKGAKTSLTQLGFASSSISDGAIKTVLKDYLNLMSKSFKANETDIKKTIEAANKVEGVKIKVDGQDGKVTLLESSSPEGVKDTYIEDMSGYEGLVKGKLSPEQAKIITELSENLKYYAKGNTLKLNEITRGIMKKDINVMDVKDWKILNNFFRDKRKGTFLQRLFSETTPDMRQRFWSMFPASVTRSMMKYDIMWMKKKGFFKTKDGDWIEGWTKEPSWVLEGLQDWNAKMGDKAIALGEKLQLELNSTLSFYSDAMPEGELLRRVAVSKMQLGQVNRIMNAKSKPAEEGGVEKSTAQRRIQAEGYIKSYLSEIGGSTKNLETAQPTGKAKIALEKKYNITNPDGSKSKMTGWEIVTKIQKTYESMNIRAHEIMSGKPEALEPYLTGSYFDGLNMKEPKLDWKKFVQDLEGRYREGKDFPTDLGIDGVRQIARSMMIDLTPNYKVKQKLMKTKLSKTGKLDYDSYFPHMFHSRAESRKAMERAIVAIKEDSKLSEDAKTIEIKKILLRTHNLTGDWIPPGQEVWDAYDRAVEEIAAGKANKEEFINWWDANQTMSSMHSRNSHIAGWSIDKNTYEVYLRNIANTYFNQINQIFSRHTIETFRQRGVELGWHKEKTGFRIDAEGKKVESTLLGNWLNYLKLYAQDAMGNPSIIPEKIYNDPSMKLKGTPYYWWADNRVKKSLQNIKKTIMGENASKYPNLDKLMEDIDYGTLIKLSNLEAKYELASLLAHPKASVANVFGGSAHTVQSAGLEYFNKGRDLTYLNKINPEFKTKEDLDAFVTKHGVIPEFIMHQFGITPDMRKANVQNFVKDIGKKMNKSGELDEATFNDLVKKHNVTKGIMDFAAKFMSVPERMLRRQSFMAHYVKAYEMFDGAIKNPDHPVLIELAKKGVKATQFLYSAPYRPAFARTSLGKIMTRFQLWQWNAVRFRKDVAREAKIFGILPGTPEYERFVRTLQIDMFVMAMGSAFAYSIFDTAMPAPYAWFQDTADWLLGNETERDRAFFGQWPVGLAPLQAITPPLLGRPLSVAKALYSNDWERFANYQVYTMFPFGRIAKDFMAPNNLIENPLGLFDKVGIPMFGLKKELEKTRKGKGPWYPWHPEMRKE